MTKTNLDTVDKVVDTLMESSAIMFSNQLLTYSERDALAECIRNEVERFTKDPKLMPERIYHLHSVLDKLDDLTN